MLVAKVRGYVVPILIDRLGYVNLYSLLFPMMQLVLTLCALDRA